MILAFKICLPNPSITFHLKSYCPAFFQADGRSTHHLELTASFQGSALPYLVISALHQQNKDQMIRSTRNKISNFVSGKKYDIYLIIEPKTQGRLEFKGLTIKSLATLGLFEWQHFIDLPVHRPVHPKQIRLKPLQYLKHFWAESEQHELALAHHQGEYLGYPRAYEPGDPLAAINWKRLAQNSYEPIVHNAITSESHTITLIVDTALSVRKRGAQLKLHRLCEFGRSLALLLEKEGAMVNITICSKTTKNYHLNSKQNWIECLNHLAVLKVTKHSTAHHQLEQLSLQQDLKIIHLSLDTMQEHQPYGSHINSMTYFQFSDYILEPHNDSDETQNS